MRGWEVEFMGDLGEVEERHIRQYVESQSPNREKVTLVQKVGSHRIMGRVHEIYDVHTRTKKRWWVITDPTNLYLQKHFPEAQEALIYHIGLGIYMAERSRAEMDDGEQELVSPAWRRFRQALEAMDNASESEHFQAVGVMCRDALIALAKQYRSADWVGAVDSPPKAADFKGWSMIFAENLAQGRLRTYLNSLSEKTWDLAVWLQHNGNATSIEADIVIESVSHVLTTFTKLVRRLEGEEPDRCPGCDSYRLDQDVDVDDKRMGFVSTEVCEACGWRSEPEFTSFAEHFKNADPDVLRERLQIEIDRISASE